MYIRIYTRNDGKSCRLNRICRISGDFILFVCLWTSITTGITNVYNVGSLEMPKPLLPFINKLRMHAMKTCSREDNVLFCQHIFLLSRKYYLYYVVNASSLRSACVFDYWQLPNVINDTLETIHIWYWNSLYSSIQYSIVYSVISSYYFKRPNTLSLFKWILFSLFDHFFRRARNSTTQI